jgi:ferritin-like metal-binding protein YciE
MIDSLQKLFIEELKDLYDAEKRLTKALPKLAKKATDDDLRAAIESHLEETEEHVTRLEAAFEELDLTPKGKPCAGIKGIIEEGDEHANEDYSDDSLRDAAIIGGAQRAEHYEMAAYGTAIAHAKLLGHDRVVELLSETLEEEKAADEKLTEIAEGIVNLEAEGAAEDDEEEEEGGETTGSRSRQTSGGARAAGRSGAGARAGRTQRSR